ncbi:hypothetical protein EON81_12560 [bacterium]|nr:MAG: hypothetical protein EON81_12560 [bacterium]
MLASALLLSVAVIPDQGTALTPPQTHISQDFLRTVRFAVKNGFGDPRGGEYREATIRRHSNWGRSEDGQAHGWLKKDGRFVAWNGLTYRPVSVGAKLDLAEDLGSAFKEGQFIPFPMGPQNGANAAALLLLLGDDESARVAWRSESGEQFLKRFLSETFNQAVAAHRGGDDGEANRQALWIKESVPRFEEFADSLWPRKTLREASLPRFDFLENVGRLADDSSRRLKNPKGRIDLASISVLPKERRIAALIAALDEVETPESGQTGGDLPSSRSLVMAFAKEGTAAIPALLDCLEKDDRLTRSVRFYRNIHPHWYFQSVKSVATAAFGEIYQIYDFKRPDGAPWDIADYRAFYAEMGDRSPAEVQYLRLADDGAGERVWIEAANWLGECQSVRREGGWITAPPEGDRSPL